MILNTVEVKVRLTKVDVEEEREEEVNGQVIKRFME